MKYLIIYAHPNPKSFCHSVKESIETQLNARGICYTTRDLYEIGFNPVLGSDDFIQFSNNITPEDIRVEQDLVASSERIIFIFPIWWFSMPAILKGYIDRVFSRGFAYDMKGHMIRGLLKGKQVMVFTTTGGPGFAYYLLGYFWAIKTAICLGIFKFCGMQVIRHHYFFAVPAITHEKRKKMLQEIQRINF